MRPKITREALIPVTQLGVMLLKSLNEEGLGLRQLAEEGAYSYEYLRRLSRGENVISKPALPYFIHRFGWDKEEAEKMRVQDEFRHSNGKYGSMAQEVPPGAEPFTRGWLLLTKRQQELLLGQLKLFLQQNRLNNTPLAAQEETVVSSKPKGKVKVTKKG